MSNEIVVMANMPRKYIEDKRISLKKYWYHTYLEICKKCGRIITREKYRVYKKEESGTEKKYFENCDYCIGILRSKILGWKEG